MASPLEMYSKFCLANWITQPNSENWSENNQWATVILSHERISQIEHALPYKHAIDIALLHVRMYACITLPNFLSNGMVYTF